MLRYRKISLHLICGWHWPWQKCLSPTDPRMVRRPIYWMESTTHPRLGVHPPPAPPTEALRLWPLCPILLVQRNIVRSMYKILVAKNIEFSLIMEDFGLHVKCSCLCKKNIVFYFQSSKEFDNCSVISIPQKSSIVEFHFILIRQYFAQSSHATSGRFV